MCGGGGTDSGGVLVVPRMQARFYHLPLPRPLLPNRRLPDLEQRREEEAEVVGVGVDAKPHVLPPVLLLTSSDTISWSSLQPVYILNRGSAL